MFSDAAYAVLRNGYSSSGYMFSVGLSNAPFFAVARAQSDVATCPMTAEYYSANAACKELSYIRQVASFLGWPPLLPVVFHLDNKTAIKLVLAPQVSVKSRHIEQAHHYIRMEQVEGKIAVAYVPAAQMRADVLTKALTRAMFLPARAQYFNRQCYI